MEVLKEGATFKQGEFLYIVTSHDAQGNAVSLRLGLAKNEKALLKEYKEKVAEELKAKQAEIGFDAEAERAKMKKEFEENEKALQEELKKLKAEKAALEKKAEKANTRQQA